MADAGIMTYENDGVVSRERFGVPELSFSIFGFLFLVFRTGSRTFRTRTLDHGFCIGFVLHRPMGFERSGLNNTYSPSNISNIIC